MYNKDGTEILRPMKNIIYTILHVISFFLSSERNDVKTKKSQLKNEISFVL